MAPELLFPRLAMAGVTLGAYGLARGLFLRYRTPLLQPVFLGAGLIIGVLVLVGWTFADYRPVQNVLTWPLGPATVALALPVYNQWGRLRAALVPLAGGVLCGTVVTIATVLSLAALGHVQAEVLHALAFKSVTAAIAVELAKLRGADPALTAIFVVTNGMLGAILGPSLLTCCRITNPVARGVALGTISHGQGTAAALLESETAGAMASLAMTGAAIVTALIAPVYVPWLLRLLRA